MRHSGVRSGEVAAIHVVAGFLVTFTAGFSLPVTENRTAALSNFSLASIQSAGERPDVSINANPEKNNPLKPSLPMCCPVGWRYLGNHECEQIDHVNDSAILKFPTQHDPLTLQSLPGRLTIEDFHVFTQNPCIGDENMGPATFVHFRFKFLSNGSVYMTDLGNLLNYRTYCFAAIADHEIYEIMLCYDNSEDDNDEDCNDGDDYTDCSYEDDDDEDISDEDISDEDISDEDITEEYISDEDSSDEDDNNEDYALKDGVNIALPVGTILSVPFLLLTFLIYSLIPELRNMHGCTLCGYVGSLIVAYPALAYTQLTLRENINNGVCKLLAFIIHFSFLSSFFWLNVMCFDIWWTFNGIESTEGTAKRRERKTLIVYSIYVWGSTSLVTGACVIMDFIPSIPTGFIKPGFGIERCWFMDESARALYFGGPVGIIIMCNIWLFISTTMKISRHKKDTAHYFRGVTVQRHDDNKQRFNLNLKLFIMMGINWSTEIINWLFGYFPRYGWYISDVASTLQGPIIFIIFVWQDKTKRLLLERLAALKTALSIGKSCEERLSP